MIASVKKAKAIFVSLLISLSATVSVANEKPLELGGCRFGAFDMDFELTLTNGKYMDASGEDIMLTAQGTQEFNGQQYIAFSTAQLDIGPEFHNREIFGSLQSEIRDVRTFWVPKEYFDKKARQNVIILMDNLTAYFDRATESGTAKDDHRVKCTADGSRCIRNLTQARMRCIVAE